MVGFEYRLIRPLHCTGYVFSQSNSFCPLEDMLRRCLFLVSFFLGSYVFELLKTTPRTTKKIDLFHRQCLRSILSISRWSNGAIWTNGVAWYSSNEKKAFCWTHPATFTNQTRKLGLRVDPKFMAAGGLEDERWYGKIHRKKIWRRLVWTGVTQGLLPAMVPDGGLIVAQCSAWNGTIYSPSK